MPFDITFTPEEFEQEFEKDPTVLDRLLPALAKKEFTVRSKEDNATYEQGLKEGTLEAAARTLDESTAKEIADLTGIKQKDKETAAVYRQRVLKTYKAQEAELTKLKAGSTLSEAEKQQIKDLEQSILDLNTAKDNTVKDYETKLLQAESKSVIALSLNALRGSYTKTLPQDLIALAEQHATAELLKSAVLKDGKLTYLAEDGVTVMRNQTTQLPITTDDRLKVLLKTLIDPTVKSPGAGSSNNDNSDPDTEALPEGVTTKVQLTKHLLEVMKLKQDSPEFFKQFKAFGGAKLPLR